MAKQLPALSVSLLAISSCNNGKVDFSDKITDRKFYKLCKSQLDCYEGGLYGDYYMLYCMDNFQDQEHTAKQLGCDEEFDEYFSCIAEEIEEPLCPQDYETEDAYMDALGCEENEDYSYYYTYWECDDDEDPWWEACDKKADKYQECIDDFMGAEEDPGNYYYYDTGSWG